MSIFIPSRAFVRVDDKFYPQFTEVDRQLRAGPTLVYEKLFRLAYKTGVCWPSQEYLALICKTTVKSVQTYLRKLTVLDYISVEQRDGHNVYTLLFSPRVRELLARANVDVHAPLAPQRVHAKNLRSEGEKFTPYLRDQGDQESPLTPRTVPASSACAPLSAGGKGDFVPVGFEKTHAKGQVRSVPGNSSQADFEQLYVRWPVKKDHDTAQRIFCSLARANKLPPLAELLAVIERFSVCDKHWKNGCAPLLSTWLRNHRWLDEPYDPASSSFGVTGYSQTVSMPSTMPAAMQQARDALLQTPPPVSRVGNELIDTTNQLCGLWPHIPRSTIMAQLGLAGLRGLSFDECKQRAKACTHAAVQSLSPLEWVQGAFA